MEQDSKYPVYLADKEKIEKDHLHCSACPKLCRHTCPVAYAEGNESYTPWAIMNSIWIEKQHPNLQGESFYELPYYCSSCRACQGACKFHQDIPSAIHLARSEIFSSKKASNRVYQGVENFNKYGNIFKMDAKAIFEKAVPLSFRFSESTCRADIPVLIDCVMLNYFPNLITSLVNICEKLSLFQFKFAIWDGGCCGLPLYDAGDISGYEKHIKKIWKNSFEESRVILGVLPDCVQSIKDNMPKFLYESSNINNIEIRSIWKDILVALKKVSNFSLQEGTFCIYYPPLLSRSLQESDIISEIINILVPSSNIKEGYRTKEDSFCSGAGGGLPWILPDVALNVAKACVENLKLGNEDTIVTSSVASLLQLKKVDNTKVVHLIELLENALCAKKS